MTEANAAQDFHPIHESGRLSLPSAGGLKPGPGSAPR